MPLVLSTYVIVFFLLIAVDLAWLGWVARSFYVTQLGDLMKPQPGLVAAGLFYAVYAAGLVHFAVLPGLREDGWPAALVKGALLGLVAYATYDLSNLATLKGWPLALSVVDLAWGTALSAVVAAATCAIADRLNFA